MCENPLPARDLIRRETNDFAFGRGFKTEHWFSEMTVNGSEARFRRTMTSQRGCARGLESNIRCIV
jgi:hypothetical protein